VGKSSLVLRFSELDYLSDQASTIGVSFVVRTVTREDGSRLKLQIWDTAGQEQYHSLASLYYRNAQAAIVVFDVTQKSSFEGVRTWVHELAQLGPEDAVIVVVGNKSDLAETREVSKDEAQLFATSRSAFYIETSAKTGHHVNEMLDVVSLALFKVSGVLLNANRDPESTRQLDFLRDEQFQHRYAPNRSKCCLR